MSNAAPPRSILVLSGRYHIMSNASIVNNCIIYVSYKRVTSAFCSLVFFYIWVTITDFHHLANLKMPNGDPQDGFLYPILTRMIDSYIPSVFSRVNANIFVSIFT